MFQLIENSGLHFAGFHFPPYKNKFQGFSVEFLKDLSLQKIFYDLSFEEQASMIELVYGDMDLHTVFTSKLRNSNANLEDSSLVPYLHGRPVKLLETISKALLNTTQEKALIGKKFDRESLLNFWFSKLLTFLVNLISLL